MSLSNIHIVKKEKGRNVLSCGSCIKSLLCKDHLSPGSSRLSRCTAVSIYADDVNVFFYLQAC